MKMFSMWVLTILTAFSCISYGVASSPVFIQAIQSALATIPFSGFPMTMTAGLAGAKLAVGAKLLYYLGLFGRTGRNKPPNPQISPFGNAGGMNNGKPIGQSGLLPMPYAFLGGGGFPGGQIPSFSQSIPPQAFGMGGATPTTNMPPSPPSVNPAALMSALAEQGINPLQLMQALESAGLDPEQLIRSLTGDSDGGQHTMNGPGKRTGPRLTMFPSQGNFAPSGNTQELPHDLSHSFPPSSDDFSNSKDSNLGNDEDVESFFSFMKDMDDNRCISRLICDIGADSDFLGEFSRNIDTIIRSLDVSPESGAYEYIQVMNHGRNEGNCDKEFPECDEEAYDIVKSVAPSVGVPGGINSETVNKL